MSDFEKIKTETLSRMEKSLEALKADFAGLRAGRATPVCLMALWLRLTAI